MTAVALFLCASLVLALAVSQVMDLRRQARVRAMMDGVLTRRGHGTLDEITLLVRENRHVLAAYRDRACGLRSEGRFDDAAARITLGYRAIADLAPDFLSALSSLRRLGRSVSVMVSIDPVRVGMFATYRLRGLAAAAQVAHYALLAGRQRVLLRLRLVTEAFKLALRWLGRAVGHARRRPADATAWRRIDALVSDLGAAGDEAIVTARQIVQALDAAELGSPIVRRADG